jgi:hypothetical protein
MIRLACGDQREFKIESAGQGRVALSLVTTEHTIRVIMTPAEVRHLIAILETVRVESGKGER